MKIPTSLTSITKKIFSYITIDRVNKITSFILVAFLWAPHGARECVTAVCSGPYFISPMIGTFLMPNWVMDMTLRGWSLQLLFAPPLLALLYALYTLEKRKYFACIQVYAIRWSIMWFGILAYYNLVFWGSFREYLIPLFSFATS